jgi:hypothetical protein
MDAKRILEVIQDVKQWRGDVYRLAVYVAAEQRATDAQKAENAGYPELAEEIRAATNAPEGV